MCLFVVHIGSSIILARQMKLAVSGRILTSLPVFDNARRSHIVCSSKWKDPYFIACI